MMLRFRFIDGLFSLILLSYLTSVWPAFSNAALYIGAAPEKSPKLDASEDILLLVFYAILDSIVGGLFELRFM